MGEDKQPLVTLAASFQELCDLDPAELAEAERYWEDRAKLHEGAQMALQRLLDGDRTEMRQLCEDTAAMEGRNMAVARKEATRLSGAIAQSHAHKAMGSQR